MVAIPHVRVRAKIVLVVSECDMFDLSKELSQHTATFNFTQILSDMEYANLLADLKAGDLVHGELV